MHITESIVVIAYLIDLAITTIFSKMCTFVEVPSSAHVRLCALFCPENVRAGAVKGLILF